MKTFIVRPFGEKIVKNKLDQSVKINFDMVENELIKPAMGLANLKGGTTGEVFKAGDIRSDMFSELLLADLVIADISIHNANVFYELGIRHALRDKRTVLIKSKGFDDTPFDIIGYRYIAYDFENPAKSIEDLVKSLKETIESETKDSPVFNVLPALESQDTEKFHAVPQEFVNELDEAISKKDFGKIWLLKFEVNEFPWRINAYRLIGKALLWDLEMYQFAKEVIEEIKKVYPNDIHANYWLSTVYERLARKCSNEVELNSYLDKSDRCINILIKNKAKLDVYKQAENYALKARNLKTRWTLLWNKKENIIERQKTAIGSQFLIDAIENYILGFDVDLNHYYSGINAFSLLQILLELKKINEITWENQFENEKEANKKILEYEDCKNKLSIIVQHSIDSEIKKMNFDLKNCIDPNFKLKFENRLIWAKISKADIYFVQNEDSNNHEKCIQKYINAIERNTQKFNLSSAMAQIELYSQLGINAELSDKVLIEFKNDTKSQILPIHTILFSGHMIDKPERPNTRFPKSKIDNIKNEIYKIVSDLKSRLESKYRLKAISGGACGGDLLFQEVCEELNIETEMFLAMPREEFITESVSFAGNIWIDKFDHFYDKNNYRVLSEDIKLPKWLTEKENYSIWKRNNLWEFNASIVNGEKNMTLVTLWDGNKGDRIGGTEDMVNEAGRNGAKVEIIKI